MRILHLHQYFNTPDVAGGTRPYEMCRRLVESGHQVTVVSTPRRGKYARDKPVVADVEGIVVHFLPIPYSNVLPFWGRVGAFTRYAVGATRIGLKTRPDVVVASSTPLTVAIPGLITALRWSVPFVFEVRDLWPHVPISMGLLKNPLLIWAARWLERTAYRRSTRVIALSPGMARGVQETGYPVELIRIIPNASDLDAFKPALEPSFLRTRFPEIGEGPVVLYAGAIGRANRVTYLVEVASEMLRWRTDVRFTIVGSGSERTLLERRAHDLGLLGSNVFVYDRLPKADMPALFASATVVTSVFDDSPALEDNSANKFFDGLASGRPVVINYGGWQAELLRSSGAGLVLERDPFQAASSLASLLSDAERVQAAGRAARKLAEDEFSRDVLAKRFEATLMEAFENGRRA